MALTLRQEDQAQANLKRKAAFQKQEQQGGANLSDLFAVTAMPLDVAIATAGAAAAKESWNCFKPHFDYVKDLDKNYEELEREYGYLTAVKDDMIEQIEIRMSKNARTTYRCDHLLGNVRSTESKFQKLQAKHKKAYKCLWGMCPFFKLRKLGEQVVDTKVKVVREKNEMEELMKEGNVMIERRPEQVATKIVDLNSLSQNVQQVLKLLRRDQWIGIYGSRGVGKTTLLEKLQIEANKNGKFGTVILISCQREDGERKIQADLLRQLNLSDVNMEDPADKISETLKKMKYLLLLDHVYSVIELHKVGIPSHHDYGKVIIASTQKFLCRKMGATRFFAVKGPPPADALALFQEIVGEVVNHEGIKETAELIVKQLGRLPWLIRAVATTLKDEDTESEWRRMLRKLQSPTDSIQDNMQEVYNVLRLVYDKLSVDKRRCLRYVALFPRDHEIYDDYLVECWKVQGFIEVVQGKNVQSFREARDEGHNILKNFEDLSLLERCQRVKHLKMPEELRMLALMDFYPNEESCKLLVVEEQTEEHPPEENWKKAHRISLMCNKLCSLPKSPKCCKLITLLLQRNKNLKRIPKPFFAHMSKLKILDLFRTEIEALPPSLFSLINLQGLYLNSCGCLQVLSSKIAKLQNLEVLDIRCTGIQSLPVEIGQLNNLKCFRFSLTTPKYDDQKVIIPRNLVMKLRQLEELTIIVGPGPMEQTWRSIVNDIAKEVASLEVLTTLCFHFPDVESLKTFIKLWSGKTFTSYKLLVGYHGTNNDDGLNCSVDSTERLLRYSAGQNIPDEIRTVLKQATTFELIGHKSVPSLSDFDMENMKSLKVCVIEECENMESIVDSNKVVGTAFPVLEELHIMKLQRLNCIWTGAVVRRSLVNLRALTLNDCRMLKKILSLEILQLLRQLQCLTVENCSQIREIIETENHSQATTENVEAENQSQSTKINEAENSAENYSEITEIVEAENHTQISNKNVEVENQSQRIEIGEAENHVENHCQITTKIGEAENHVENRCQITTKIGEAENHVENRCQITKVVKAKNHSQITTEIVGGKNQSQSTEIGEAENHCEIREVEAENHSQITTEIVEAENLSQSTEIGNAENYSHNTKIAEVDILSGALPKLEILKLINLPSLVSISESDTFFWPCLEKIEIKGCPKLSKLSLSTTNASELSSILCNKHWWEGMQQSLQDDLRQRIQPLCSFIHEEEQPCVPGTSPGEKGCSSSSMNAAAGPPTDPSSSNCRYSSLPYCDSFLHQRGE
ncbi:unnamed protein product [Camellia sinensis]